MNNREVADTFRLIGDLLEIKGEVIYKILAYRKAAESLDGLGRDINQVWHEGRLNDIPGVGKAISEKITELLSTGKIGFLERLKEEVPPTLAELLRVPDVGPRKAAMFWRQAGITTLAELETAAREGRLRELPGLGEKSEARILEGINVVHRRSGRVLLGQAWPVAQALLADLRQIPGVTAAEPAGSLRRMRATVGDLDLVAAAADPRPVMEVFTHHPQVSRVISNGESKSSVELHTGLRVQLWIQPPERFGTVLQYATGSKDHNVRLRELAQAKGYSLSEKGLQRLAEDRVGGTEQLFDKEESLYAALGLPWIPPELREDRGEIAAARAGRLPELITLADMQADLHNHTTWSDGAASIRAMAEAARSAGLRVLAITDHSSSLGIVGGMTAEDLPRQRVEIDAVQAELGDSLRILQGAEVEIHSDGSLDYPDEVLASLDFVIASLHVSLRQPRDQITARLIRAIQNPHVDLIGHPTGVLLPDREGADLDMEAVFSAAASNQVALEISADYHRLDLNDVYARLAIEKGALLSINCDAHAPAGIAQFFFGIATARRGWVTPASVINTWPVEKLLDWLTKRKTSS